jgi:hypothetical protein
MTEDIRKMLYFSYNDRGYTKKFCIYIIMAKDIRKMLYFYYNDRGYTKGAAALLQ